MSELKQIALPKPKRAGASLDPTKLNIHHSGFNVSAMREKRKRSRQAARFIGPLLDGFECKKEENFNPYIQPYTGGDPYCVMVPPKTKNIIPLTEEGLDDWFAQSQNRKIESLVLAKKDFFVPHVLTEGVRGRWLQKPRPFVIPTSELQEHQVQEKKYFSLYHDQEKISPRLLINEPTRLLFEYSKLLPKNAENGTAVKIAFRPRILGRLYDHAGGQRHKSSNSGSPSRPPRASSPKRMKGLRSSIPQEEEESSTVQGPEESISNDRSFSRSHLGIDKKNGSFGNVVTNAYYQQRVKKVFGSQRGSKEGQMMNEDWILESGSKRSEILKEELVKESEEFLAQLIVRIKKQKEDPASLLVPERCMTPMNVGTLGDAGLSALSSNRISRRFSRLNSNNTKVTTARSIEKKPAAEIMSLSVATSLNDNNKETVELFSRLRKQLKGDYKRQIDEKKLRKILPLEQQHELSSSEPRSASTRYGSIRTPLMQQRFHNDSIREVNPLLSRSINASPMGSLLTPKSIKIPQRRDMANLSLDMGASVNMGLGSQLNSHAKETLSNKFFDQLLSPRSSSMRYEQQQQSAGIHHFMEENFGKSSRNSTFRNSFNNTNKLQTILSSGGEQPLDSIARSTLRSRSNSRQKGPVRIRESAGKQVTIDFKTTSLEYIDKETLEFEGDIDKKLVNNTQFWFVRGTMQMNNGNYYNAIDCFKQILVINPQYYIGIFNIGCMYERLGKLDLAKKWLQLSYDMDFYKMECIYGFALCAFKAGEYQQCYDYLIKLEINNPEIDVHVYYLTALCCKELLKFDEASICYYKVNEAVKTQACAAIAQKVLTKLFFKYRKGDEEAAPTAKEDKDFMEDSVQILHEKSVPGCIFDDCITAEKEWKSDSLQWVSEKLSTLEFWKRFPIEYLRTFLGYIQVEKFSAGNVIFLKKGIVYVIISGSVWLKDHSTHFLSPKVMSHLREGDIIGYDTIDNNIYCQVENWLICHSNVEVWSIKKPAFENIWEAQKTLSKNVFADSLYDTVIFKRTTPQTLFKLAYDMSKREVHQAGRIIYNDNSYIKASEFNAKIKHKVLENKQLPLATLHDTITVEDSVRNTSPVHHTVKEIPRNKSTTIHPVKGNLKMEKKDNSQASLVVQQTTTSLNNNPAGYKFPPTTLRVVFCHEKGLSGECHVENHNGHIFTTLTRGEFFGENLLLETKAYNNFGLIKCKTAVETLFIPQSEFWRIPRYELEKMYENCVNRKGIKDLIDHHHHHHQNNGNQHHPHHVKISRRSAKDLSHLSNRS